MNSVVPSDTDPILPLEAVRRLLASMVPDWEFFAGRATLSPLLDSMASPVGRVIRNLSLQNYPSLYEDERRIVFFWLRAFLSVDEIKELSSELEASSADERALIFDELETAIPLVDQIFKFPRTWREALHARRFFNALPRADQSDLIRHWQYLYGGAIATFYQCLSVMIHGEKLTDLVRKAKAGDDDAFLKAIQADPRILYGIPYFTRRYEKAKADPDQTLRNAVTYRSMSAPHVGRVKHRSLWMSFAVLDWLGWLDRLSNRDLLLLLDEAGVGAVTGAIADETGLGKCRRQYRAIQKSGALSTQ